ncbi:hypothetical protein AB7M16_004048 [Bradyrhizobium sp. USDA 372]
MPLRSDDRFVLLRAVATAVLLSTMALLNFYAANMSALAGPSRVLQYAAGIMAIAAVLSVCLALLLRKVPPWRIVLAVGLTVFVFFAYRVELVEYEMKGRFGDWAAIAWTVMAIATGIGALIVIRRPALVTIALVASLAFAALPVTRIATALVKEQRAPRPVPGAGEPAMKLTMSPNIYWIVLDAYPRQDVLKEDFSFDNSGFLASLRAKDFTVFRNARSNFPATANSISSTANADYTVEGEGKDLKAFPLERLYPLVRGKNRTVARLTSAGYSYVHFENGYDNLTKCAFDGPRCLRGNVGLDEMDVAILSNTPIIDLIIGRRQSPFAWGGVDDLTRLLNEVQATPSPFFLYAHILVPHIPFRFTADCGFRSAAPDLQRWDPASRPAFLDQLRCTNSQTLTLVDKIVTSDPNALIILQSDHGTDFRGQTKRSPSTWSDADLHERFGVLNAIRLPKQCRAAAPDDITLIDTFPLVFACLTGGAFEPRQPRFFVTPYDDMPDFGDAVEFPAERVR